MTLAHRRPNEGARGGFTIVEMLIAITIATVGLLALIACSNYLLRSLDGASRDTVAAVAAQSGLEQLAGSACASLPLNTVTVTTANGITRRTRIVDNGNDTRAVLDSLSWKTRIGTRRTVVASILPCRPGA